MINTNEQLIKTEHLFVDNVSVEVEALLDLMQATFEEYMTADDPPEFDRWNNLTRMTRAQISMLAHISELLDAFRGEDPQLISQAVEIQQARKADFKKAISD